MKSMTGFAQGRTEFDDISIYISFKSLNHRFLDVSFKGSGITPKSEKLLKEIIKHKITRGKVEIIFNLFDSRNKRFNIQFNENLLVEILDKLHLIRERYGESIDLSLDFLLKIPMIFHLEYVSDNFEEAEWNKMKRFIEKVFKEFLHTRETEGRYILKDLFASIKTIENNIKVFKKNSENLTQTLFLKYKERIEKILLDYEMDEKRILQEAAILADKSCINEEINRLETHTRRLKEMLKDKKTEIKGREADFLAQEMQRETHTIASKTDSREVLHTILETRREIEKIKQQVQNVE
ncbi:MAG: YicC family protein [Candidatus Aminicenantes bacterium]|nr:YicC family protein [Candidatus Aminicenantes bacterium]